MLLLAALTVGTLSFSSFFIARSYVERATLAQLSSLQPSFQLVVAEVF